MEHKIKNYIEKTKNYTSTTVEKLRIKNFKISI